MTARKVAKPRVTAKARLVAHCDWMGCTDPEEVTRTAWRAKTRRLLALTIREELAAAADRAGVAAYDAARVAFAHQCPIYKPDGAAAVGLAARTAASAAVLASSGRRKGRK